MSVIPLTVPALVPGLDDLWALSHGDPRVCVAVLDGPVQVSHPSFSGANLTQLGTLVSEVTAATASARHGTHIASVIFGQHGGPIRGIAPHCRGISLAVFGEGTAGSIAPCSQLDLARAILRAIEEGANVINVSGGELADPDAADPLLADAVQQCVANDVLVVGASGNDSRTWRQIPAALPGVLPVRATAQADTTYPDWRDHYRMQGVFAPGQAIMGASPDGGTTTASGSSFATAIVSGVAALLLSIQLKTGLRLDAAAVRRAILQSAWQKTFSDPDNGCPDLGQLNIPGALELITEGVRTMSDSTRLAENGHRHATENGGLGSRTHPMPELGEIAHTAENGVGDSSIATQPLGAASKMVAGKLDTAEAPARAVGCGCGCSGAKQLVYSLGQLGYDFGTEARRDSIMQHMGPAANPHDARQLLAYLKDSPWDAASIIWTLNLDSTPVYGLKPSGPFAREICERLREFLGQQLDEGVERISVPGQISGKATLMNGQVVPLIVPQLRGMYSWTTRALVEAVCGTTRVRSGKNGERSRNIDRVHGAKLQAVGNFLERVYFESRNLGVTSQERAINYAATNALNIERVYQAAMQEEMDLDTIEIERSPVCRPDSDCWDVKLLFFFPQRQVQTVRKVYRFTVDVSDVVPVMVGKTRSWFVR